MRFAEKFGASTGDLVAAMKAEPEANLGGGVCKFRMAREGGGKSGGARVIVALKAGVRVVMMFGFEKKDMDNITQTELREFRKAAKIYLAFSDLELDEAVNEGALIQVSEWPSSGQTFLGVKLKPGKGGKHGKNL